MDCPTVRQVTEQDPPQQGPPGDETWPTYSPPTSRPPTDAADTELPAQALPPTHVPYGSSQSYSGTYPPAPGSTTVTVSGDLVSTRTRGCGWIGLLVAFALFIPAVIGVIAGIRAISSGVDGLGDVLEDNPLVAAAPPDLTTPAAFDDLVAAVRQETGGTTVIDVTLYPEYAVVYVPVDATSKRYFLYYYDGELRKTSQGSRPSVDRRFDMSTIDAQLLPRLFQRARTKLVENPTSTYLIIKAPGEHDEGAWFRVYATNDFQESGYFTADQTGKLVSEHIAGQ